MSRKYSKEDRMSNGMKALGIVAVVLVVGAVFSGVYGSGWMGSSR